MVSVFRWPVQRGMFFAGGSGPPLACPHKKIGFTKGGGDGPEKMDILHKIEACNCRDYQAEQFLAEGLMDFAIMARAFMADPEWSGKARRYGGRHRLRQAGRFRHRV